jgi:hypothetical protein
LGELPSTGKIHGTAMLLRGAANIRKWVSRQRNQYKMQQEGKKSFMTLSRIQELRLGFEWDPRRRLGDRLKATNTAKPRDTCNVR